MGAVPGLSVTMATALLVSLTYTWSAADALAMAMGVYVVGVYSGAVSAILVNIPGAPSNVVTAADGYKLTQRGEARKALIYTAFYSFTGSAFGLAALALLARPASALALRFQPADYFLLAVLGLVTAGGLSQSGSLAKGLTCSFAGLFFSLIGIDPVMGTPRLTFGIKALNAGIQTVPALIGLFGLAEVFMLIYKGAASSEPPAGRQEAEGERIDIGDMLRHFPNSLVYSLTGVLVGALPGAGSPVASFIAYGQAARLNRKPSRPFGEGAVEGVIASETANNACIGGAMIPMLTLGIPGDAVTAVMAAVFTVHGIQPGPLFLASNAELFGKIIEAGFISCVFLLLLGLFLAPRMTGVLRISGRYLVPAVALICAAGAYASSGRLFDVGVMVFFGLLGFFLRLGGFPLSPLILGLVLGGMADSNFRRAVSLASTADNFLAAMFGRPITLVLLALIVISLVVGGKRNAGRTEV